MKHRAPKALYGKVSGTCKHCGNPFEFAATLLRRVGRNKFCSPTCWYEWQRAQRPVKPPPMKPWQTRNRQKQRVCKHCGKSYTVHLLHRSIRAYCSKSCYLADRQSSIPVCKCPCGKTFRRCLAAKNRNKRTFCSRECVKRFNVGKDNPLYRGRRHAGRGITWKVRSQAARERDKTCKFLIHDPSQGNNRQRLSVDHIVAYRLILGFNDETLDPNHLDNLISSCRSCHTRKTQTAERRLLKGDIVGFKQAMRPLLPMEIVDRALMLYGLG